MLELVADAPAGGVPKRYLLVALCFAATFICYIDRVNISVAIIPMAEEYHWSPTTKGLVLSSFFIGYLLAMLPSGALANRFGGKLLLGCALLGWSLFTLLTPAAAGLSLSALILVRILMGTGEAASFPAVYNLLARWFPVGERTRAATLNLTGIPLGTIFALSVAGWLVTNHGWHSIFYAFGLAGVAFAAVWFRFVYPRPSAHPTISNSELALLAPCEADCANHDGPPPWRRLWASPAVRALTINHFCGNWTFYLMLTWLPSYFRDVQHLPVATSGLFAVLPWLSYFVGLNVTAYGVDRLVVRGVDLTLIRKTAIATGLIGAGVGLVLAGQAATPAAALWALCGTLGVLGIAASNIMSNHLDIAPRHADAVMGITNTAGTIPGVAGVAITGWLLDITGGYSATFVLAAAICVVGAIAFVIWGTGQQAID